MITMFKLFCLWLLVAFIPVYAEAITSSPPEMVIVHVLLNGSDAGTHFMQKKADDFMVTGEQLQKIGVNALPQQMHASKPVSLKSLHAWLDYALDSETGDLLLTVTPTLLPKHEESLRVEQSSDATWIQSNAMFVNYTLDYTANPNAVDLFRAPFELGASIAGTSLTSQFDYNKKVYRRKTQWVYDRRTHLQRWALGDIQASSGVGGAALAGIHVFKNFSMNPNIVTTPGLATSILLENAADIEVLMDGNSVYKGQYPAGMLNLKDIPFYRSGSIQAQLVVRDVFGREKTYQQLLYGSTGMLAQGLNEYDVALGVQSTSTGTAEPTYGNKPLFYGRYRYGVSNTFTPSVGFESDGNNHRMSIAGSVLLGTYGQLDTTMALSKRVVQGNGHFFRVNYNYVGTSMFSPSVFFNSQSIAYGGIVDSNTLVTTGKRREYGSSIAVNNDRFGGLTARWTQAESFTQQITQTGEVLWNTVLPKEISLTTQFGRTWSTNNKPSNQLSASLGHSFRNGLYLSAHYSSSNQRDSFGLQLQWSPPLGEGFGVDQSVNQQAGGTPTTYSRVEYRNQYGDVSVNGRTAKQSEPYQVQLNSAFVWTEGDIHISRPVRDGFALVRINGMKGGVKVNLRGQYVGTTNAKGELLVPYMYAYIDNLIAIEPKALSLAYAIDTTSQNVTMPYRGGGLVEFDVVKLQIVEGSLWYSHHKNLQAATYSTLEYQQNGKKKTTVVGDDGYFYLENIPAGAYAMTVFDHIKRCEFTMIIPDSDQLSNDIGQVICVVDSVKK